MATAVLFTGCQLHEEFPIETITETDVYGNYTGNIDPEDWVVKDFKPSDLLKIASFTMDNGPCNGIFVEELQFTETNVKPTVKVFPNPLVAGQDAIIEITFSKKIRFAVFQLSDMNIFSCEGSGNIIDSSGGVYRTHLGYGSFPGDFDTEIVLAFIASDSSTFITAGHLKID